MAINHDNKWKILDSCNGNEDLFTESYEGVALPRTAERFAYIILSMIPPVLVVVILQKWFIKGLIQTEK